MTPARHDSLAIVTIVSNNYLHFARTMLQSARRHHPHCRTYCVIVDRDLSHAAALRAEFEPIAVEDLGLPLGDEFLFQYSILELNTAVKPWVLEHLFERGHTRVVYIDPDIHFYQPMTEVTAMLATGTDIVLTPHLLAAIDDHEHPTELDIRRAGAYNLGFCAVRDSENTRRFLHWWQGKLTRDCVNDPARGVFVDQSWVDLVPGLFDRVGILRHRGYNVAYWNIAQRPLKRDRGRTYRVGQEPLVFFHFSGLDLDRPLSFSVHQSRFTLATAGQVKELARAYVKAVAANGHATYKALPYGFGTFSNGETLPNVFRSLYRQFSGVRAQMGARQARPFSANSVMCDPWTDICASGVSPTLAMMAVWHSRQDLRAEFPLNAADSIVAYYRWFVACPPADQPFCGRVVSEHRELLRRLIERAGVSETSSDPPLARTQTDNDHHVRALYKHLLNRAPDPGGLAHYSAMCGTDAGLVRAWGDIGLSEESRKSRLFWFRMVRSLLALMRGIGRRSIERSAPAPVPSRLSSAGADAGVEA